jgi:hypothetical protein
MHFTSAGVTKMENVAQVSNRADSMLENLDNHPSDYGNQGKNDNLVLFRQRTNTPGYCSHF